MVVEAEEERALVVGTIVEWEHLVGSSRCQSGDMVGSGRVGLGRERGALRTRRLLSSRSLSVIWRRRRTKLMGRRRRRRLSRCRPRLEEELGVMRGGGGLCAHTHTHI